MLGPLVWVVSGEMSSCRGAGVSETGTLGEGSIHYSLQSMETYFADSSSLAVRSVSSGSCLGSVGSGSLLKSCSIKGGLQDGHTISKGGLQDGHEDGLQDGHARMGLQDGHTICLMVVHSIQTALYQNATRCEITSIMVKLWSISIVTQLL